MARGRLPGLLSYVGRFAGARLGLLCRQGPSYNGKVKLSSNAPHSQSSGILKNLLFCSFLTGTIAIGGTYAVYVVSDDRERHQIRMSQIQSRETGHTHAKAERQKRK